MREISVSDSEKVGSVLGGGEAGGRTAYSTTSKSGLPPGWTRTTVIIREKHDRNLEAVAYLDRTTKKALLDEILESYFAAHPIDFSRLPERLPEHG